MRIAEFTTENKKNPIGIGTVNPRFSWKYDLIGFEKQSSYRICVSREEAGKCDMWDSGMVSGSECLNIVYCGKPLKSKEIYFVRLFVTSESGKTATFDSSFETGLLYEEDWKGRWIGTNANYQGNTTIIRRVFNIDREDVLRARAYVIGLGYHEVFLNGEKVAENVLSPSLSDFNKRVYYNTYDLTGVVRKGDNCFALELGYGWYGQKKALVHLLIEYSDKTRFEDWSNLDLNWWVGPGAYRTNSIYGGEEYDARLPAATGEWKLPSYRSSFDNGWLFSFYQLPVTAPKYSDMLDPIRVCAEIKCLKTYERQKDTFVYDFGQNIAGWVKIKVRGDRGSKVVLRYAEVCLENGDIDRSNLRAADAIDIYILSGNGIEEYTPRFTYHGFRYVEASLEGRAEIMDIVAQHIHNGFKQTGYFRCSDETLNLLHEIAVRTEKNNLHSIMTDCPQRDERFAWLNDLSSRLFQNINNFDLYNMLAKTADDIADTQDEKGAIADTAPFFAGTRPADPVSISYLLLGLFAYKYYGDVSIIEKHYQKFAAWVDYLLGVQKDYILELSYYGDWVVPDRYADLVTDRTFVSSVYLNWHLRLMKYFAEILNKPSDAQRYDRLIAESTRAINEKFYDKETKNYANKTQSANAMALSIGIAPEEDKQKILENIIGDIQSRNYHCVCGNQGYRHLYYELCKAGHTGTVLKILKNPQYPGYGYMLRSGATTVWERWEREIHPEMHSFDHPMFASYDGIFYHYLAGIIIDDNARGCDRITIRPSFDCELEFVECSLDTIRGKVVCNWEKTGGIVNMHVEIPPTVIANFDFEGEIEGKPFRKGAQFECGVYDIMVKLQI